MKRGGFRPGSGRKPNAVKAKALALINEKIRQTTGNESGMMPLDYMLMVLRDVDTKPSQRMEAARAAAPYIHPRLAITQLEGGEKPLTIAEIKRSIVDEIKPNGHDKPHAG